MSINLIEKAMDRADAATQELTDYAEAYYKALDEIYTISQQVDDDLEDLKSAMQKIGDIAWQQI